MASWTVGLTFSDLIAYAQLCLRGLSGIVLPPGSQAVLGESHCQSALKSFVTAQGYNLVSTRLQPVRWSDVGGLEDAKQELKEAIQLPILYPELFSRQGVKKRSGILFYGPPGCGKTLLAKAVATEMNMNFMSVKGPELINQYVGESERNIRALFQRARDNSPCIIFFDELDALAPARGAKGDGGGAMDRIVAQLLVEVDGVGQGQPGSKTSIFIIGATNRPDLLDPSLLRPGRFDRLCYLGLPATKTEQLNAVKALTRKFSLSSDVDLEKVVEPLDFLYTGADFFALCSDAMMFAVNDTLEKMKNQTADAASPEVSIAVTMNHFIKARDQLKASVSVDDLKKYEAMKNKF
ncbi:Holliday junction DNA helicase RuvB P-loop domain/AAA domain (Cdc48 subfamily)/ATPase family associated with various cellular activities (AAA), putative [Angomonas deanei]|uniref:Peroxisomal ATPase PEX6 n=1 Tax=Angomonas deanei TaxID=59799 RepID=A0A7G2C793_9TRYP|nr:Holliday junction DNA helicase RuvB P-loop domain/AAA domain (Cdc48 subfamily)/ATPase family associated with various cellular activities (AAA), putative [Angomonas deanei]